MDLTEAGGKQMPERVAEERSGWVDAEIAGFVDHQQCFIFICDAVTEIGLRFGQVAREILDTVVQFKAALRFDQRAVEQNLAGADAFAPLFQRTVGKAPGEELLKRQPHPGPVD